MSHDIGDRIQHAADITHYVVISIANDFKSLAAKKRFSLMIARRLAIVTMAIKFNYQSCFQTGKVANVVPNGVLSSKMNIGELLCLQPRPQQSFGKRGFPAQFACAGR